MNVLTQRSGRRPSHSPSHNASSTDVAVWVFVVLAVVGMATAETRLAHAEPVHSLVVASLTVDRDPDHRSIRIAWRAPQSAAVKPRITGYRVAVDGQVACHIDPQAPLCCLIDGPPPKAAIDVAVVTEAGLGPWVGVGDRVSPSAEASAPVPYPVPATYRPVALLVIALWLLIAHRILQPHRGVSNKR